MNKFVMLLYFYCFNMYSNELKKKVDYFDLLM